MRRTCRSRLQSTRLPWRRSTTGPASMSASMPGSGSGVTSPPSTRQPRTSRKSPTSRRSARLAACRPATTGRPGTGSSASRRISRAPICMTITPAYRAAFRQGPSRSTSGSTGSAPRAAASAIASGLVLTYVTGGFAYANVKDHDRQHVRSGGARDRASRHDGHHRQRGGPDRLCDRQRRRSFARRQLDREDRISLSRSRQPIDDRRGRTRSASNIASTLFAASA